jgi:hypothetical protein
MFRFFSRPIPLLFLLAFASLIPLVSASILMVQIPTGQLPEESLRFGAAPWSMWLHALAGVLFAVLGPVQFARAIQARFGVLHRLSGRVFVLAGLVLGLSGLNLLFQLDSPSTLLLDCARGTFGAAVIGALALGVHAARTRNLARHRAWMIRAYAICMAGPTVGLVLFPIYLAGWPVTGLLPDLVFVGWSLVVIGISELVIVYIQRRNTHP